MTWATPIEALEARRLMAAYTDVSQLAALTAPHAGPTNLYIDFDGGTVPTDPVNNPHGPTVTIRPFEEEAGDNTANRERDIQDVLFEVSEIFAPFNVQVHRGYYGIVYNGSGDTTVFVGANEANSTTVNKPGVPFSFKKFSYSVTFPASNDYPRPGHTINSDRYDVAFVDTVLGSTMDPSQVLSSQFTRRSPTDSTRVDVAGIAEGVAHEAGHTFGLSHVRADGKKDPTALSSGTIYDLMAYGTPNQYFADQSLNLTSANNNGTTTTFTGVYPTYLANVPINGDPVHTVPTVTPLATQNSYLTLQDVLGARPRDQYANVADASAVDSIYALQGSFGFGPGAAPKPNLGQYATFNGTLSRPGDYHVLTINTSTSFSDILTVSSTSPGSFLKPEILVYDSTGKTLVSIAEPSTTAPASVKLGRGTSYEIVIGSEDGNLTGSYSLAVTFSFSNAIATHAATGGVNASASAIVPLIDSLPAAGFSATPAPARPKAPVVA